MASKSAETSRNFNPMSAPNLSDEMRRAVNAAFDAMSTWRTETLSNSEKSFEQVMEKISEAARALGWPEQVLMLPVRNSKALLKCKSKRWIKSWTLGRNRSNHRTRHCRFCRSSSPSRAFSRSTLGQALPKWQR